MGEDLKKTGAGNLFTVFGEPDIELRDEGDELVVELKGVDVYDPTTGEVRSNATDQVALWMIDTDYDGSSFFVRHCYFTGGQDPYKRLKTALKADIDADAWAHPLPDDLPPLPQARHRQDRGEGHQRLRRRGRQGLRGLTMRTATMDIRSLMDRIDRGEIRLPEIQRADVWRPPAIAALVESLYRGYPSGSLLLWEADGEVEERKVAISSSQATPMVKPLYLLDGQQRLTSLHRAYSAHDGAKVVFNVEHERFQIESVSTQRDGRWVRVRRSSTTRRTSSTSSIASARRSISRGGRCSTGSSGSAASTTTRTTSRSSRTSPTAR